MRIGVPKELQDGQMRVAMTPDAVTAVLQLGHQVMVESGAGVLSKFSDTKYLEAGATIVEKKSAALCRV